MCMVLVYWHSIYYVWLSNIVKMKKCLMLETMHRYVNGHIEIVTLIWSIFFYSVCGSAVFDYNFLCETRRTDTEIESGGVLHEQWNM